MAAPFSPESRAGLGGDLPVHYPSGWSTTIMNENVSLIAMCLFLLASLAFLAQQLTSYH
jgi:hypothetical protein